MTFLHYYLSCELISFSSLSASNNIKAKVIQPASDCTTGQSGIIGEAKISYSVANQNQDVTLTDQLQNPLLPSFPQLRRHILCSTIWQLIQSLNLDLKKHEYYGEGCFATRRDERVY
jgi:hypothetical protein